MKEKTQKIAVVGAGPVGCLLATMLAGRGFDVEVFEKRPDMRRADLQGGRSINLVLTDRGLRALAMVGLRERVLELTVPVLGRMMHSVDGELAYQPYGKDESECNYSVSRGLLNQFLLDAAEEAGVRFHFEYELADVDFDEATLRFAGGQVVEKDVYFGCDGAPSALRKAMVAAGSCTENIEMMRWGYRELVFPAAEDGSYAIAGHALHIWPRGHHFLMGLANLDGSFTGTIYLPQEGPESFAELNTSDRVLSYFEKYHPDAVELLGDFVDEFLAHPQGHLGTVRAEPWHVDGRFLLVGDAAHGIVPFFGQGLNAGFEDCVVLDELLDSGAALAEVFESFFQRRKSSTDAIADMALENFNEMSEKVGDPSFLLKKKIEHLLEQELSPIYRSRYAMVMYSPIPYWIAFVIGEAQKEILSELAEGVESAEDVDLERARRLIEERLVPLYERYEIDLDF